MCPGKYPFDTQVCEIRYLTWMHTNRTLTVAPEQDSVNLDAQLPNGEWDIISVSHRERERERAGEGQRGREKDREREK